MGLYTHEEVLQTNEDAAAINEKNRLIDEGVDAVISRFLTVATALLALWAAIEFGVVVI